MSNDEEESRFTKENREPKEMVRFDGMALTKGGKWTKTNYFAFLDLDLDDYSDMELTHDQAKRIHHHMMKVSTGISAMTPLYCSAKMCPFKASCVWMQMGKAPTGKRCPTETNLMKQWTMDIVDEFDVDPQNFTELAYVNEIVELMILERRLNMNISKVENAELIVEQSMGVDREGDPITQKVISPFIDLKEKLANRRTKIIKLMVGDRQEKYKKEAALKVKLDSDPSGRMAAMRSKLEDLNRQLSGIEQQEERRGLSPEDIIDDPSE